MSEIFTLPGMVAENYRIKGDKIIWAVAAGYVPDMIVLRLRDCRTITIMTCEKAS